MIMALGGVAMRGENSPEALLQDHPSVVDLFEAQRGLFGPAHGQRPQRGRGHDGDRGFIDAIGLAFSFVDHETLDGHGVAEQAEDVVSLDGGAESQLHIGVRRPAKGAGGQERETGQGDGGDEVFHKYSIAPEWGGWSTGCAKGGGYLSECFNIGLCLLCERWHFNAWKVQPRGKRHCWVSFSLKEIERIFGNAILSSSTVCSGHSLRDRCIDFSIVLAYQ